MVMAPAAALADTTNVSFLTHWSPETVAKLEAAAAAYSKDHPDVAINVRAVPFGDLLTTLRASGGRAGGATIAGIYNAWLPDLAQGQAAGAGPRRDGDRGQGGLAGRRSSGRRRPAARFTAFRTRSTSTPSTTTRSCSRRPASRMPPKTWDEFIADAKALTDKSKGQQGFGLINSWAAGVIHPFASLLASNGGELVADGKPQLDSDGRQGDLRALREPGARTAIPIPTMGTSDANTTGPFLDNFVSGKTGMIIMANWWESALKSGMGDKFADIATAPIPVGPHGDKPHSISYSWMTVVNAKASRCRAEGGVGLPELAERPDVRARMAARRWATS